MKRFIVKYRVSENLFSFRAVMAEDEAEAVNMWNFSHNEKIEEVHIATATDRGLGLGYYTEEEEAGIKNNLNTKMKKAQAEKDDIKRRLSRYTAEERKAEAAYNEAKKGATTNEEGVHVGDIFYISWGYDQTNIDFFQVVKVSGKHTITLKALDVVAGLASSWSGLTRPIRDSFRKSPIYPEEVRVRTKNREYNGYKLSLFYINDHGADLYKFGDLIDYSTGA